MNFDSPYFLRNSLEILIIVPVIIPNCFELGNIDFLSQKTDFKDALWKLQNWNQFTGQYNIKSVIAEKNWKSCNVKFSQLFVRNGWVCQMCGDFALFNSFDRNWFTLWQYFHVPKITEDNSKNTRNFGRSACKSRVRRFYFHIPYTRHYNPLLIWNDYKPWILAPKIEEFPLFST